LRASWPTAPRSVEGYLPRTRPRLEARLSDPGLYARDALGFAAAGKALDGARASLAASEDEWLRLEMLRESVERLE